MNVSHSRTDMKEASAIKGSHKKSSDQFSLLFLYGSINYLVKYCCKVITDYRPEIFSQEINKC